MTERDPRSAVEAADSSSSMVALRTIVMIAFLVAIPLMAVIGAGLPDSLRTAMQGAAPHSHFTAPADGSNELSPAATALAETPAADAKALDAADRDSAATPGGGGGPDFFAGGDAVAKSRATAAPSISERAPRASIIDVRVPDGAPRARVTQVRAIDETELMRAPAPSAPLWAPGPRTAASPRGRNTTAHFAASDVRPRTAAPKTVKRNPSEPTWQATAYSTPAAEAPKSASAEQQGSPADDPFARGERRLRQYGATHYRLESWGDDGELFRCSANVALPNHRYGARHFEATAASPSQAIDGLLEQVEAWRASQR